MTYETSYKKAFVLAVFFHFILIVLLTSTWGQSQPVLVASKVNQLTQPQEKIDEEKSKPIEAVSVDSQAVYETIERIKAEKAQKLKAEKQRQLSLEREAKIAREKRLQEQKKVERLKQQAAKLAKERKQKLLEEKKALQKLEQQKQAEAKRLAEMKQQQDKLEREKQNEAKRLAELQKKKAELAKQDALRQKQIEAERLALEKQRKEQIAGEVNRYKALIINAISRKWILPEYADPSLSSQFRIRLAPTGAVLDVSLTRSSGDPILDRSAQSAIYKASPLPVPQDPEAFNLFRDIQLTVRPENARG